MKESYNENLANYIDHESCMVLRKEYCEALTVAHMGWVLSPESRCSQGADAVIRAEGNRTCIDMVRCMLTLRGRRPHARVEILCTGTRRSC